MLQGLKGLQTWRKSFPTGVRVDTERVREERRYDRAIVAACQGLIWKLSITEWTFRLEDAITYQQMFAAAGPAEPMPK
ncbi:MAG: hypothetical protein QOJ51_6970 [Acidobacteriaceae bacterium]|jgi:hypothetical protein|nr:hypothetical protein [Acidobacteriaceae bacterium]